jgi:hypothetical protein
MPMSVINMNVIRNLAYTIAQSLNVHLLISL